jgi:hypothetical protein
LDKDLDDNCPQITACKDKQLVLHINDTVPGVVVPRTADVQGIL